MIHVLMCTGEYRQTVDRLKAPASQRGPITDFHRKLRTRVDDWFSPEKNDENPTDTTEWTRNGEGHENYTELAVIAMAEAASPGILRGIYAAQCAMTHPNVVALGEIVTKREDDVVEFTLTREDIDKMVRMAFLVLLHGLTVWSRYFLDEQAFDTVNARLTTVNDHFEAASAT